jgi:hypothetical protein
MSSSALTRRRASARRVAALASQVALAGCRYLVAPYFSAWGVLVARAHASPLLCPHRPSSRGLPRVASLPADDGGGAQDQVRALRPQVQHRRTNIL